MTSLKGDLRSIMGTPFGGVGHAVLIFSRVTRAAFNSDSVVLQLHDRIEMPEEADGKFHVDGLDPGPIRIELEGGTVHNHGWNIDLPDEGVWSLTDLVDAQVDWSPAVIGRAEAAAREARDHADRAEAGADRVGTAEQVGVWASEASASASSAASARSGAQTARNAAQSARDAAEGHANRAATSESNAAASESAAKQSEDNAGDYAAVATTAATEAVDAMELATDIAVGEIATRSYIDSGLATKADKSYVDNATNRVGHSTDIHAGKFVKLDNEGKLFVQTASITSLGDIVNKAYVDSGLSGKADKTYVDTSLETKADKSALGLKADKTYVDDAASNASWYKGSLGETHLDTIVDTGMRDQHSTPTATADKGYPEGVRGYLICIRQHGAIASQSYVTTSAYSAPKHWVRTTANAHAEAPAWSPWKLANKGAALKLGSEDLDTITEPNDYVQGAASYATPDRHYPERERGILKVTAITSSHIHQVFTTATETPAIWTRSQRSGVWEEWALVARGGDSDGGEPAPAPTNEYPGNPYSHMVRELNLRRRLGHIRTGGKAAVTMIFDHGTKNWRDIVYPALLQRGLTATLAINGSLMENGVARWGHDESITWDTIKSWHNAHMEIANHGMYHDDAPDVASQLVEIRDSREKLESELGITIDTWVGAGISGTQMNGFYPVTSISKYADYTAGRIVLDNHAVAFGNTFVPNYTWPMDGTIPQGPIGQWLDRGTQEAWDAIDSAIDHAVAVGGRTIVRCHPQYMGMPNMYTEQFLLDFLDYLKARVDAGEIVVLQANRWAVATP